MPEPTGLVRATGRRKEAIVRVRLVPGTGTWKLNGRTLDDYFPNKVHQQLVSEPFKTVEKTEQYDVLATLRGGGVSGQAGALRLGIARALIGVVTAELYTQTEGIGVIIRRSTELRMGDRALFGVLIFTVSGIVGVEIIRRVEERFQKWRPATSMERR